MKASRMAMVTAVVGGLGVVLLSSTLSLAAVPAESRIGEHFKVIPAAGGTGEITVVANGLNFYEDGAWHESQPQVLNFSSGIVCTGAS